MVLAGRAGCKGGGRKKIKVERNERGMLVHYDRSLKDDLPGEMPIFSSIEWNTVSWRVNGGVKYKYPSPTQ